MPCVLIVGYGNPLRCDDGVAWRAVDALDGKFPKSQVEFLRLHQLAPEIADALRGRELVIFLDAACVNNAENGRPGEIHIREIAAAEKQERQASQFSHVYSPGKILELARELYGATPKAIVVTVAGKDFGHGDRLSDSVANALPSFVSQLDQIIREHIRKSRATP